MAVRALTASDWVLWRNLRLEALLADPGAFGSTHEREVEFDEATRRQRLTSFQDRPMLVSMWVRPSARGLGCGRRLVDAAVAWAGEQAAPQVMLWVVRENLGAIHLYESCGFVASGTIDALASDPCTEELEMRLALA